MMHWLGTDVGEAVFRPDENFVSSAQSFAAHKMRRYITDSLREFVQDGKYGSVFTFGGIVRRSVSSAHEILKHRDQLHSRLQRFHMFQKCTHESIPQLPVDCFIDFKADIDVLMASELDAAALVTYLQKSYKVVKRKCETVYGHCLVTRLRILPKHVMFLKPPEIHVDLVTVPPQLVMLPDFDVNLLMVNMFTGALHLNIPVIGDIQRSFWGPKSFLPFLTGGNSMESSHIAEIQDAIHEKKARWLILSPVIFKGALVSYCEALDKSPDDVYNDYLYGMFCRLGKIIRAGYTISNLELEHDVSCGITLPCGETARVRNLKHKCENEQLMILCPSCKTYIVLLSEWA